MRENGAEPTAKYGFTRAVTEGHPKPRLNRGDLWWLLALPAYQILSTLRHEGSHALAGMLEGARVTDFVFIPTLHDRPWILWGYVRFEGPTSWWTDAAPYLCDIVTFGLVFGLLVAYPFRRRWIWINLVALGLFAPLLDSLYNYTKLLYTYGDLDILLHALPDGAVHAYFLATLLTYAALTFFVLNGARWRRGGMEWPSQ